MTHHPCLVVLLVSIFCFSAWITLGYPVSETPNEPKFVGSVTRVNIWTRALAFEYEIPTLVRIDGGGQEFASKQEDPGNFDNFAETKPADLFGF